MSQDRPGLPIARDAEMRARNRRLGLILASIALVFFFGVIVKHTLIH